MDMNILCSECGHPVIDHECPTTNSKKISLELFGNLRNQYDKLVSELGGLKRAKWHPGETLPPVSEKHGDSEMLLCIEEDPDVPFVGWYNSKTDSWTVAHHSAPNIPRSVRWWRDLPPAPFEEKTQ